MVHRERLFQILHPVGKIRTAAAAVLALVMACPVGSRSDQEHPKQGLLERVMHPDTKAKSAFQDKLFSQGPTFASKTFATGEFDTGKPRSEKSFLAGAFSGVRNALLGNKLLPPKNLPDKYLTKAPDASRTFSTGSFASRDYADAGKTSPYQASTFATREISLKGKSQGSLDNDPKLQDAVRKGLSIDDVRNLLNKGP